MQKKTYTDSEVKTASLEYFEGNKLSADAFVSKYALRNGEGAFVENNPDDMHWRMANEFARIEKSKFKSPLTAEQFHDYFKGFQRIIPQGSPMYGIGNIYQYISVANCFAAGTRVFTDRGAIPIEQVKIGDLTVSHNGLWRKISQTHKNPLNGRTMFRFKCFGTPEVKVTDNHQFLSLTKEQEQWGELPQWNPVSHLRIGDWVAVPSLKPSENHQKNIDLHDVFPKDFSYGERKYKVEHQPGKISLSTIVRSESSTQRLKKHKYSINSNWEVDSDFAYFLGLWYGDGCVFGENSNLKGGGIRNRKSKICTRVIGITFTFGSHEKALIKFASEYGCKLFGIPADVDYNEDQNTCQIIFHSPTIGMAFEALFGRRCDGKKMLKEIFTWPKELVSAIAQGLADSDGCLTETGDLRVVLKNTALIESFYHLLRAHNFNIGITYGVRGADYARLDFRHGSPFSENCGKTYADDRVVLFQDKQPSLFKIKTINGRLFVRVDEKTKWDTSGIEDVYTIGVEDDHSYAVEGLVSLNCFVVPPPFDSYAGICQTDQQIVQICKRRGGVGWDVSNLRPSNSPVHNAARTSTGMLTFAERFSNSIREVAQNGRRGASMQTVSVHHPEILGFAKVKLNPDLITGSNLSIRLSDEFLNAVTADSEYQLRWPVDSKKPSVSEMIKARIVWKTIIECAHAKGEPGLLFWDTIIRESVADCYAKSGFTSTSTNPCSEIILANFDSCRLLLLNLWIYVDNPFTPQASFNFERFTADAKVAQRLMDNLVDIEIECIQKIMAKIKADPEPEDVKRTELELWQNVLKVCQDGRRTGTGITALGDTLAALGLKYDSDEAIAMTSDIYRTLKLACYRSSVDMAKELGAFPVWNHELEKDNPFLLRIKEEDPQLWEDMKKYGRRNIALLTTAPAGSVSILAQTTSGIEPEFKLTYVRRRKVSVDLDPNDFPITDPSRVVNGYDFDFLAFQEAAKAKGVQIDFIDDRGDFWHEYVVESDRPAIRLWKKITGETDINKSPWFGSCSNDLNWKQRVKLQAAAQRHVDHSISSTLNLPKDATVEQVAEIYETAWKAGCKGVTVYRDGCRDGVMLDKPKDDVCLDCKEASVELANSLGEDAHRIGQIIHTTAPKRPIILPCDIHRHRVEGKDWLFLVGLLHGAPYEVWGGHSKNFEIPRKFKTGWIIKDGIEEKRTMYDLYLGDLEDEEERIVFRNIGKLLDKYDKGPFTRVVSWGLRHGAPIRFLCETVIKDDESNLHSFSRIMARVMKKYISDGEKAGGQCPQCNSTDIVYRNGCPQCQICQWTHCS